MMLTEEEVRRVPGVEVVGMDIMKAEDVHSWK